MYLCSMEIGMCPPLSDRNFVILMTENGNKNIDLMLKYYPELKQIIENIEGDKTFT